MFGKYVRWICYKQHVLPYNQNHFIFIERRQILVYLLVIANIWVLLCGELKKLKKIDLVKETRCNFSGIDNFKRKFVKIY